MARRRITVSSLKVFSKRHFDNFPRLDVEHKCLIEHLLVPVGVKMGTKRYYPDGRVYRERAGINSRSWGGVLCRSSSDGRRREHRRFRLR